jgi:hypothetical protein
LTPGVPCGKHASQPRFLGHLSVGNLGKPCGIVFDFDCAVPKSGGGLVLHNHPIDVRVLGSRLLWISKYGQLVLEPLKVLLDTIDSEVPGHKGWQPELFKEDIVDLRF